MLKKVFASFSSITLIIAMFFVANTPMFINYSNNYEVYLDNCSNSQKIINLDIEGFEMVFGKKGESVCVEKQTFNLHNFLLEMRARVVFSEHIDGKTSYYAYSPKIKYMQEIKKHNINLHIVVSENTVKVGSPIIYGSF